MHAQSGKSDVARMRAVAVSPSAMWKLARDSVSAWIDDFAPSMGAAISYYTVFSIAPLLLIVIALLGMVFGREAASGKIFAELSGSLGPQAAEAIQGMVKSASSPGKSAFATIVGIVMLLLGATTVFVELQSALDRIWRSPAVQRTEGILKLVTSRLLSFGIIMAVGFLLLVSFIVSSGLSALGEWWAPLFGGWEVVLQVVNFVVSLVVVTILFAMIYKIMPRARIGWVDVWIGAAVTALLFSIGKLLIGLYIGKSGVVSSFGAAGSVLVILLWVYYSAQIFLLGAEFTWHFAYQFGSRRNEAPPSVAVAKSALADSGTKDQTASVTAGSLTTTSPMHGSGMAVRTSPPKALPVMATSVAGGLVVGLLIRRYGLFRNLRGAVRALRPQQRASPAARWLGRARDLVANTFGRLRARALRR